jgi:hypothetical protein
MRTSLYLPDDLADKVRELGISISAVAQAAIRKEIDHLTTIEELRAKGMTKIIVNVGVNDEDEVGFFGRWLVEPDPEIFDGTRTKLPGHAPGAYYGVALTKRGRIAVYEAHAGRRLPGKLKNHDDLKAAEAAGLPADVAYRAAKELGDQRVTWLDI